MNEDLDLLGLLNRAHRVLYSGADRVVEQAFGITSTQLRVLLALTETEPTTPSRLARRLQLKKPAVTGLGQRMEAAGLISRVPDPSDGRSHRIVRTEKGRRIAEAAGPLANGTREALLDGLSEADLEATRRVLNHVIEVTPGVTNRPQEPLLSNDDVVEQPVSRTA